MEKQIKTKVIFKHETEENWALSSYVPQVGEQIFVDADAEHPYQRIKYGDGENKVKDLPYSTDAIEENLMNKINARVEIVDVDQLPENYEEVNPSVLYRITREIEGAYNGLLIVYDIDATPTEVPASLYLVNSLPNKGVPSPEVGYLNINLYKVISEEDASYAYINNEWRTGFTYKVVNDRSEVNPEPEAGYFLITGNKSNSIIYTLNGQDVEGKPTFKNITDAIVDVEWLPHINEADSEKIYRVSDEFHGALYIKNVDGTISKNTFNNTPVSILIVDVLPEKGQFSTTTKAFIYYQKSDNRLYWRLIENDGWQELSEAGINYQIVTSIDEIVEHNLPYVMVSGDDVKKVEGGFYVWDEEWKKLITTDLLEYELNNKASTMLAADEKRLAAYEGSTRRPFDQSLFDALKNQYRVYVESGNYGGVYPVIALTDTGEGRVFNPWGFNTLEDMFNGQHWPLSWDGNIITEATTDNPTGWYKVIRDEDGNAISYHPTLGTIVQRYNDGNIRVPQNPRDSRDATSKAYVDSKHSASTSYTNTKFNEAKAYTDANSFANPNIGTYAFTYKGSNGLGSIPYCSDDSPNSTDASIRSNTAVVRTKAGEVMCITNDSSKKQAAVNKQFLEEQLTNQAEVIIDEVNTNVAPEIVAQAAQITANAVVESKTGNELILRDINPNASTISIHTEPNITVRACTPVVYSKDRLPVSNTNAYGSGYADIYPPKHQKYKLSCLFENPNNNNIALVAKLDDSGNGYAASSSATSGKLSVIVDLTEKTYVNKIRLRFYSNYSSSAASASDVVFSNIKFELIDETIEKEGTSTTTSTQGTTDENGNLILAIPDWSPIIIYNINDYDMEVSYNQDLNQKISTLENKQPDLTEYAKKEDIAALEETINSLHKNSSLEFTSNGDGTCVVTGIGDWSEAELIIPSTSPSGDNVVRIASSAFNNCTHLSKVVVPDSVEVIEQGAFSGCSSLESITLPFVGGSKSATIASRSTLFGYIFGTSSYTGGVATTQYYDPYNSVTYYIPDTLKSVNVTGDKILSGAFYSCKKVQSIVISDSVTSIGSYAFLACFRLEHIVIGNSVTTIDKEAFLNCTRLTSVVIPDSVTSISEDAFRYCSGLTIYCEAEAKPNTWDSQWNSSNRPVVWGFAGDFVAVNKKFAIGEWLPLTDSNDLNPSVIVTEFGVYEIFCAVEYPSGWYRTSTFLTTHDPEFPLTDHLFIVGSATEDETVGSVTTVPYLEENGDKTFRVYASGSPYTWEGDPSRVVLKVRKIRDI